MAASAGQLLMSGPATIGQRSYQLDGKLGSWEAGCMKTTLDLPNDLVREIKLKAVHEGRKLKDAMAELKTAAGKHAIIYSARQILPAEDTVIENLSLPRPHLPIIAHPRHPPRVILPHRRIALHGIRVGAHE